MDNVYLTEVIDGETVLYKVNRENVIPQDVLIGTSLVDERKRIKYDGRNFYVTVVTNGSYLTNIIECDYLKLKLPIICNKDTTDVDSAFIIGYPSEEENPDRLVDLCDVYLKDVVLYAHCGSKTVENYNIYISTKDKQVPMVANIYDDGRVCFPIKWDTWTHPINIISDFENAEGNMDLVPSSLTQQAQLTKELDANEYYRVIITPHISQHITHELKKYIKFLK